MSGRNSKSSKHSSSKKHKDYVDRKTRKNRYSALTKKDDVDSKTPPLPVNTIDELIKQRESLRKELERIEEHSVNKSHLSISKENKKRKSIKEYQNANSSKRHKHENSNTHVANNLSPEPITQEYLDSEDEENIIEQRRKERKQLIEKLSQNRFDCDDQGYQELDNESSEGTKKIFLPQTASAKKVADMFSEKDDFSPGEAGNGDRERSNTEHNPQLTDNWDDAEGYYIVRPGDTINNNRYTVKDILGQGVFANVVRAQDNNQGNMPIAIKIIRNNELMYKTGLKEIETLKKVNISDPCNKYHCVKLIDNFMHRGHLCLVLESLHMDLRMVLKKYGKQHGLNMKALISYSRQLLLALRLLKKIGIVHADIKPDNILVNEKKNVLKLCDFGSATKVDDYEPTPYLVSRFYRAPEIILGIPYKHGVDLWSTACTIYEIATGKIMFTGSSNNKMLKCFMDLKGKIPSRLIRKGKFKDQHFNYNNNFLQHKKDELTGRDKVIEVSSISPVRDLLHDLKKHCKNLSPSEDKKLCQLKDLLEKMLMLDSNQRLSILDCLKHPFFQEVLDK